VRRYGATTSRLGYSRATQRADGDGVVCPMDDMAAMSVEQDWRSGRRIVHVAFTGDGLANVLRKQPDGTTVQVLGNLPADAEYLGAAYSIHDDQVLMRFRHPSFERVLEGNRFPIVDGVSFKVIRA